ncbi:MAG: DUF2934 domain-containing protein [Nitrospirota bacterium]
MNLHDEISKVAYELYEKSGRMDGRDLQNWLEAERIVMARYKEQERIDTERAAVSKDRRAHYRLRLDLPIVYIFTNKGIITARKANTHDLSDSGIGFYAEELLAEEVAMKVTMPGILDPSRVGTVRWCRRDNNLFRVGVFFQ